MVLMQRFWNSYRWTAERFPWIRRALAPIRFFYHYGYVTYLFHRARGLSYREWYALTLDKFAKYIDAPPVEGCEALLGSFQLDYLVKQGLKPTDSLVDFGCGYLRAGVHFIPYLNPGRYVGVDISQGRLEQGWRQVARLELQEKKPELILVRDLSFKELAGRRFDFIWCYGVLGHMPLEDIDALFKNISCVMDEHSVFFANYTESDGPDVQWVGHRHIFFSHQAIRDLCLKHGLESRILPDWHNELRDGQGKPHPLAARDRMLKITRAPALVTAR